MSSDKTLSYVDIEPLEPEWLIPGLVPKGFATLGMGDGGVGKGQLWSDWAGRITTGRRLPGVPESEPAAHGSVLLVSSEDDPNMSTAWRLRAAHADLSRVYDVTEDFSIPETLASLDDKITEIGDVELVVIDPLADNLGFIPGTRRQVSLTSGNVTMRRYVMRPLERLARRHGIALFVIHHTVKDGRMAGSKGISDAARQLLRITRPEPTSPLRLITVEKTNIASGVDQIGYTIQGEWPDVHVEYVNAPSEDDASLQPPSTSDRILAALASSEEPVDARMLAGALSVDYGAVRTALSRLKRADEVINVSRGLWTIRPQAELVELKSVKEGDK